MTLLYKYLNLSYLQIFKACLWVDSPYHIIIVNCDLEIGIDDATEPSKTKFSLCIKVQEHKGYGSN